MAAISKTKKIETLTKTLQKRFKNFPVPPERPVLDHLIYAALLENTSFELADSAYTVLQHYFIDWNEIRVSTVGELADTFTMLPDPQAAGARVRRALQGVFEKTYMFDLEDLRKKSKNLGHAVEFLESLSACSRYMIDYTTQVAFGGHVIPLDEAALRVFRLLGLAQVNKEGTREEVPGLERGIPKKNGLNFSLQLHHFAAGYFADPASGEFRTILKQVDPESLSRDWTPPVLVLPKAPVKATLSDLPKSAIPFVAPDDDDFEDEQIGTEAEFISDGSEYRSSVADAPVGAYDDLDDAENISGERKSAKKSKESKSGKVTSEKQESVPEKKVAEKKMPAKTQPVTEKPKKKSTAASQPNTKKVSTMPDKDVKKIPQKPSGKNETKTPEKKKGAKKSGKPPHPDSSKSTSKPLQKKKPK